jgi:hypothetical protein
MSSGFGYTIGNTLLVILFVSQVYFFFKMLAKTDADLMHRYRFFGPFAFAIPGVLKPGGIKFLLAFLGVSAVLFSFAMYLFDFADAAAIAPNFSD